MFKVALFICQIKDNHFEYQLTIFVAEIEDQAIESAEVAWI